MVSEEEKFKEIRETILKEGPKIIEKEASITYNKKLKQYSLKIPKEIALKAHINPEKHTFLFKLTLPDVANGKTNPVLVVELKEKNA